MTTFWWVILVIIYIVVLLIGLIVFAALALQDRNRHEFDRTEKLAILGAVLVWPLTVPVVGVMIIWDECKDVPRKMNGKYWTLRAKLAKEEDGSIWNR